MPIILVGFDCLTLVSISRLLDVINNLTVGSLVRYNIFRRMLAKMISFPFSFEYLRFLVGVTVQVQHDHWLCRGSNQVYNSHEQDPYITTNSNSCNEQTTMLATSTTTLCCRVPL